jgi:hypothetical protein
MTSTSSLSSSELRQMKNRILSQDRCSDKDLEKLSIINELLGEKTMKVDKFFDKLNGWQWLIVGIVAGLIYQNIVTRPQPQTLQPQVSPNTVMTPNGGAVNMYKFENN